ncbi:AI-2E family transporter [Naasia lichenicola]|uniref:AI-2E family transporter n=1 Tax=Naasia lichenicola TaxID=2565933 RepID=A0A4S4FQN7_9MICO|nr:AI-2E family transporter [Naasia lichenicola]THG31716.1 AI-2E family transporter [Naasia lichenicola]
MKILNPFRIGLLAGLGVLVAIGIGTMVGQLATILTYVGAAIFLALGLDPLVSLLERRKLPRWAALLIVVVVVLGAFVGIIFAVVPTIVGQGTKLVQGVIDYGQTISYTDFIGNIQSVVGNSIDVQGIIDQAVDYVQKNAGTIGGGVFAVTINIASGLFGGVIVIILTLYFTASLDMFKSGLYQLVPATRRAKFADIAEQISQSVGRYVIGQASLALVNGILSFIFLSIMGIFGAQLPAVFAFIAFLFSLVPLVGTISGSILIILGQVLLVPNQPGVWLAVAIYYVVYMQVEAYVLSPAIMNRAVKVPGVIVVIAALVGGTLLGVLGALIAIPVAASILLIIKQVIVPRQNEL